MADPARSYFQQSIGFFKAAGHLLTAALLLQQGFRVPLTTRDAKEISAINVQRTGQLWNRIAYGMDNVAAQRLSVFLTQCSRTRSLNQTVASRPRRQKMLSSRPVYSPMMAHIW